MRSSSAAACGLFVTRRFSQRSRTIPSNVAAHLAAKNGVNPRAYVNSIQTLGDPSMSYNSIFSGAYAQDTWKPQANVTITYGAR